MIDVWIGGLQPVFVTILRPSYAYVFAYIVWLFLHHDKVVKKNCKA